MTLTSYQLAQTAAPIVLHFEWCYINVQLQLQLIKLISALSHHLNFQLRAHTVNRLIIRAHYGMRWCSGMFCAL